MHALSNKIIAVIGTPRSGTSLTMQCISAAGVPCMGNYPAFEDSRLKKQEPLTEEYAMECKGRAVKVLDPHLRTIPDGFDVQYVLTHRSAVEQARSHYKILLNIGRTFKQTERTVVKRLTKSIRKDNARIARLLDGKNAPYCVVDFAQLVTDPRKTLLPVALFLGLKVDEMAGPVIERSPRCLDGMLETRLL